MLRSRLGQSHIHIHNVLRKLPTSFIPTPLPTKWSVSGLFMIKCGFTELPLNPLWSTSAQNWQLRVWRLGMVGFLSLTPFSFCSFLLKEWHKKSWLLVTQMQYISYWLGKPLLDTQSRPLVKAWARTPQWDVQTPNLYLFYSTNQGLWCYYCCERKPQSRVYISFARRKRVRHGECAFSPNAWC